MACKKPSMRGLQMNKKTRWGSFDNIDAYLRQTHGFDASAMRQTKPPTPFQRSLAMFKKTGTIVGVLAILGAGLYLFSPPFRSTVENAARSASEWSPEQMQADPDGYLSHFESKLDEAETSMQTSRIAILQKRGKLVGEQDRLEKRVITGHALMDNLKREHQQVSFEVSNTDKQRAVNIAQQLDSNTKILRAVEAGIKTLDGELQKVETQLVNISAERYKVMTKREAIKIGKIVADINADLISVDDLFIEFNADLGTVETDLGSTNTFDKYPNSALNDLYDKAMQSQTAEASK